LDVGAWTRELEGGKTGCRCSVVIVVVFFFVFLLGRRLIVVTVLVLVFPPISVGV
jgi:hypothetical protein